MGLIEFALYCINREIELQYSVCQPFGILSKYSFPDGCDFNIQFTHYNVCSKALISYRQTYNAATCKWLNEFRRMTIPKPLTDARNQPSLSSGITKKT